MTYCYYCPCGENIEVVWSMDERRQEIPCSSCGHEMERDFSMEQQGASFHEYRGKPSLAMECGLDEVEDNKKFDKEHGLGDIEYRKIEGIAAAPVYTSRAQQKKYEQARGVFNKDGGYGDSQPA